MGRAGRPTPNRPSPLGPFMYQQIIDLTLRGWLVFKQVPDAMVVAGAAVLVSSGLYLLWLETRRP